MEQYLQALRERGDVSEEVLLELEERFKVVEEVIDVPIVPTLEERVDSVETKTATLEETIDELFGGVQYEKRKTGTDQGPESRRQGTEQRQRLAEPLWQGQGRPPEKRMRNRGAVDGTGT